MENTVKLVTKKIEDNVFGYQAVLDIGHTVTIVYGDSGSGKSVLFKYFCNLSILDKTIVCFSVSRIETAGVMSSIENMTDAIMAIIKKHRGKLIVIDNADVLLNDEARDYISSDPNNQYIIFGRDVTGLWATEHNMARIVRDDANKTLYFEYWLKDLHKKYTGHSNNLVEI